MFPHPFAQIINDVIMGAFHYEPSEFARLRGGIEHTAALAQHSLHEFGNTVIPVIIGKRRPVSGMPHPLDLCGDRFSQTMLAGRFSVDGRSFYQPPIGRPL